jgi:hypothetical protein
VDGPSAGTPVTSLVFERGHIGVGGAAARGADAAGPEGQQAGRWQEGADDSEVEAAAARLCKRGGVMAKVAEIARRMSAVAQSVAEQVGCIRETTQAQQARVWASWLPWSLPGCVHTHHSKRYSRPVDCACAVLDGLAACLLESSRLQHTVSLDLSV